MKIAFCLFNYFPYGGLQRDFLRIAKACKARGHEIHVFTMSWQGEKEKAFHLHLMPQSAWQNHTRIRQFANQVRHAMTELAIDLVVGFNKMPHLDVYYAADVCYQARIRSKYGSLYRLLPRCRQLVAFEKSVFSIGLPTDILLISPHQQQAFSRYYHTEQHRFHMLPPGISKDHAADDAALTRTAKRSELGLKEKDHMILAVGSGFKTKGLDRSIKALSALPEKVKRDSKLFVIGQDNPKRFIALARQAGVSDKLHFLGGRDDVPALMQAADVLIHPAYHENTGTVLLEAMVSGLPALTVDVCGYAHYISEAKAGKVLASPFEQARLNTALYEMLTSNQYALWHQNALDFSQNADIYNMPKVAADLLEKFAEKKNAVFAS